ncbi:hypothetical protein Ddye_002347 [Dipteronia dyeriana]|uniref:Uncharacterized protein n=1 Tax=Dipteronia dyeriana TaxID=168575 RepID=A0AAD9XRK2_9ROSI|nr:hypothetical protein Ddye_002347 [Dipteronia dyeriana]
MLMRSFWRLVSPLFKNLSRTALSTHEEFLKVSDLACIDIISVKHQFDRKHEIFLFLKKSYVTGEQLVSPFEILGKQGEKWHMSRICQEQYYANELLPLKEEHVLVKVMPCFSKHIEEFDIATVTDKQIRRFSKLPTHYIPGSLLGVSHLIKR